MRVAIGSDHRGFPLKGRLRAHLSALGHACVDLGCCDESPVDYPDIAAKVATAVAAGGCERGVLVCGTGIGMSMAANKVPGVRAALCHSTLTAARSREHNDANVLCLGADLVSEEEARAMAAAFMDTPFAGGRHLRRVEKIVELERRPGRLV